MAEDPRTLHIHQHFTYRCSFDWMINAATPTGISLVGYDVTFVVLGRTGRLPALISATSVGGQVDIHPDGVVGRIRVTLTADQTGALKRNGAYALYASPTSQVEPVEHIVSGPMVLSKIGAP